MGYRMGGIGITLDVFFPLVAFPVNRLSKQVSARLLWSNESIPELVIARLLWSFESNPRILLHPCKVVGVLPFT